MATAGIGSVITPSLSPKPFVGAGVAVAVVAGDNRYFFTRGQSGQARSGSRGRFVYRRLPPGYGGRGFNRYGQAGQQVAQRRKTALALISEESPLAVLVCNAHLCALFKRADDGGAGIGKVICGDGIGHHHGIFIGAGKAAQGALRRGCSSLRLAVRGGVKIAYEHIAAQPIARHARPFAVGGKDVYRRTHAQGFILAGSAGFPIEARSGNGYAHAV